MTLQVYKPFIITIHFIKIHTFVLFFLLLISLNSFYYDAYKWGYAIVQDAADDQAKMEVSIS